MADLLPYFLEGSFSIARISILLMGLAILSVFAYHYRRRVVHDLEFGRSSFVILTILLAELIYGHSLFLLLGTHTDSQIRLTEVELVTLLGLSLGASILYLWMSDGRFYDRARPWAGAVIGTLISGISVIAVLMGHASGAVHVNYTYLFIGCGANILIQGLVHWKLMCGRSNKLAALGYTIFALSAFATHMLVAKFVTVVPTDIALISHEGKHELWLEFFLLLITVIALGLSAVMGEDPRQHWRRYAVAAVLVFTMSVSVFAANALSLRYSNALFELARLVEVLNSQRSMLYIKAMQHEERAQQGAGMGQAVSSDVCRNMQTYFDTSVQSDDLIADTSVESDIRDLYTNSVVNEETGAQSSLRNEVGEFYQYLKSQFGLQAQIVDMDGVRLVMFERRLYEFSAVIIRRARNASDIQVMIKDMALLGGVFIVSFLVFGVFLPAHKSTINALDALEAEKARIYKLALCAQHTTKGIVLTNARGQITWCNDAFCNMTGFRFSELEGKTLLQATRNPKADQSELDQVFRSLRRGQPTEIEVLACRKDESDFWLSGSITPVVEDRRIQQIVHVFNDVTEEREMKDRLATARAESERLALIARHASDGIAILDENFVVSWINPSMTKMNGYSLEDMQHGQLHELFVGPETNADDVANAFSHILGREPCSDEFLFYRKDGTSYWVEAQHTPFFHDDGSFAGFVIVHRDITERKALELELIASRDDLAVRVEERTQTIMNQSLELEKALAAERDLNRMQTEFVSMASHEFRTPLTIIDGIARRLDKRADRWKPEDIREKAQTMRATVKRMTMLVERTLDASRLSSGRIKLTPEEFSARELVEEVCNRQRELAPSYTIDIDLEGFPETLFGDARLMDNVFTNVVSNAVKYSGDNQYVKVTGRTEKNEAVLRVRDHGVGIPKEELPKIFQRFFRASTSTGIPGTGIGLNLVKSLVEMHYGCVELDSAEGEWTEFTVRLPLDSPLETGVIDNEDDDGPNEEDAA